MEYKRQEVNARSLAKSLSAFANTYGGWLFLGVEEQSKDNPRQTVIYCKPISLRLHIRNDKVLTLLLPLQRGRLILIREAFHYTFAHGSA